MDLTKGYYPGGGSAKKMSPKRSTAKARAGKKAKRERKAMKGGPPAGGYTRL